MISPYTVQCINGTHNDLKSRIREDIANWIMTSVEINDPCVLTLPSSNFLFEKLIVEEFGCSYTGVECDLKTWLMGLDNIPGEYPKTTGGRIKYAYNWNGCYVNSPLSEVVFDPNFKSSHDAAWIDFNGNINAENSKSLEGLSLCMKPSTGVIPICITLLPAREMDPHNKYLREHRCRSKFGEDSVSLRASYIDMLLNRGAKFKTFSYGTYVSDSGQTMMIIKGHFHL